MPANLAAARVSGFFFYIHAALSAKRLMFLCAGPYGADLVFGVNVVWRRFWRTVSESPNFGASFIAFPKERISS
jgi:hypothetical protein